MSESIMDTLNDYELDYIESHPTDRRELHRLVVAYKRGRDIMLVVAYKRGRDINSDLESKEAELENLDDQIEQTEDELDDLRMEAEEIRDEIENAEEANG